MRNVLIVDLFELTQNVSERRGGLEQRAIGILQRALCVFGKPRAR
jgi:hypothetical protein